MQIDGLIAHHARYRPEHTAVVFGGQRLNWDQFNRRVNRLAHAFRAAGIDKGDRVATVLPNCLELLDIYWACAKLGAVVVPLSPLLTTAGLESLMRNAAPKAVFASRETAAILLPAKPRLTSLRCCVLVGALADGCRPYADFTSGRSERNIGAEITPDDMFNIMYTSGTTGLPKGIVHTHRIRAHYGTLFANAWRMGPESVVLHTGAIVFNGAFVTLMPAFTLGARYVLAERFDAAATIDTIAAEGVTHTMMVPSQIVALLNAPNFDPARLQSLEMLLSLGAPLSVAHKDILEAALPGRFYELYGLTEGFVTILDRDDATRKRGTVGVPPPFFDMKIVREDGKTAAVGEIGEIVGRGPILMPGYYRRDDLTADAIRDGWLYTGDLGFVDKDGYLSLVDRKKDMIDSGGVKVYPRDIEEILIQHPAVLEAVVFGIPDEKWGETPAAAVTLKTGQHIDAEALREWTNTRVGARYQRLSTLGFLDQFPRNAAGKILKRELREPYWEAAGRRI
ncbi:class I adenylate-forming enzyme family protein [Denitromonas ohlonensis]|uniref:AMP-binding protein n=2 Tax=Denitromonas TaxID=139331 RepID=A0A557RR14_9RHOO|nr:AMP-binding protein [Denitromonas ohlonensis]TVO67610.1 AMP-binding protein [Denitromonas ohlonensis]TVO76468.1 AMP-binding protein [Denitromonas ohlonensis]